MAGLNGQRGGAGDNRWRGEEEGREPGVRDPMIPQSPADPVGHPTMSHVVPSVTSQKLQDPVERQPAPTGFLGWTGFGCAVFGLACLCIAFASPYWLQTYPNSFNNFQNVGLWEVCFHNYMHHKDDSQEIYNECWWVFSMDKKHWKLREWLLPPWFISCQVMVTGCLLVRIASCITAAMMFLHCCPVVNHEYHQTYAMFAAAAMEFLIVMTTFVAGAVYGKMSEDRQWMPRPDMNFLSWGFGFFVISGLMAIAAGACFYIEAKKTYESLLTKEDEYDKMALEMSGYGGSVMTGGSGYPPPGYPHPGYESSQPSSGYKAGPPSVGYAPSHGSGYAPSMGSSGGGPQGYAPPQGYPPQVGGGYVPQGQTYSKGAYA